MKRPGYREAIRWIADNDDTEWVNDNDPIASVTAALVADLFGVSCDRVARDLTKALNDVDREPSN
jgi:hypothetical protein